MVRSGDAHAWLEAWTSERGWIPVDPTPRIMAPSGLTDNLRDAYELLSGFWMKYVLRFSGDLGLDSSPEPTARPTKQAAIDKDLSQWEGKIHKIYSEHKTLVWTLLGSLSLLFLTTLVVLRRWFPWVFSIRWRIREGSIGLKRERTRMEDLLKKSLQPLPVLSEAYTQIETKHGPSAARSFSDWYLTYGNARFGRPDPLSGAKPSDLSKKFDHFKAQIKPQNSRAA